MSVSGSWIYQYLLRVEDCLARPISYGQVNTPKSIPCYRSARATVPRLADSESFGYWGFNGHRLEGFAATAERWVAFHGGVVSVK